MSLWKFLIGMVSGFSSFFCAGFRILCLQLEMAAPTILTVNFQSPSKSKTPLVLFSSKKMIKKMKKVLARGYISVSDEVKSLTHFFSIPKS